MSDAAAQPVMPPAAPAPPASSDAPRGAAISWMGQVTRDVLSRPAARLGAIWIGFLVALAVFAPFLANSRPYFMVKSDGAWHWPLFKYLTRADVVLLVAFIAAVVLLLIRSMRPAVKLGIFAGVLFVAGGAAAQWVDPPEIDIFEDFRRWDNEVEYKWWAVIPFSPGDRLNDDPLREESQRIRMAAERLRDESVARSLAAENAGPDAAALAVEANRLLAESKAQQAKADDLLERFYAPRASHLMGVDQFGTDLLSAMIHATRVALAVGFIATGIAVTLGVILGGLMGYFAGIVDLIGMRLVEIFEAIPTLFLLIAISAFIEKRNIFIMMAIIGLTGWVGYARFVRAEFFKLRRQDFVQAAIACGLPLRSIIFRHMLPNGVAPVLVSASFGVASAILIESTLSFLGLGLGAGEASWGQLLNQTLGSAGQHWWIIVYPGAAIFLTVFAYNLIGEALRDAIDPHTQRLQRTGT